eukprot:m.153460 g.153460  ORF g.153460 m.153460 type:complete len:377 (+) comp17915_c0_seq2:51-1181(+)
MVALKEPVVRAFVVFSVVFTSISASAHAGRNTELPTAYALPSLRINASTVSVSGISSGADAAVQLQIAFSEEIFGSAIFAGQAYHCAVQRFPDDVLSHVYDPSVPFCDGCPPNTTISYDHCKRHPEWVTDVSPLIQYAKDQAQQGTIDSLQHLQSRRVFLYRGKSDTTYNKGSVLATYNVLNAFVPSTAMKFVTHVDSPHLVPGIDPYLCWWEEWGGPDNCTYDGAGESLRWIYGSAALQGPRQNDTKSLFEYLHAFTQDPYVPPGPNKELFATTGRIFVPPSCQKATAMCTLHVFLHGCGVASTYDVFTKYGGFNEWAYNNNLVVLYPQMASNKGNTSQERSGCFDGYGQTGKDYALKSGHQMTAIINMVRALVH